MWKDDKINLFTFIRDGNDMKILIDCFAEAAYNNKDNIKIEKWYWTIDTTQLDVCKN